MNSKRLKKPPKKKKYRYAIWYYIIAGSGQWIHNQAGNWTQSKPQDTNRILAVRLFNHPIFGDIFHYRRKNNPLLYTTPTGREILFWVDEKHKILSGYITKAENE